MAASSATRATAYARNSREISAVQVPSIDDVKTWSLTKRRQVYQNAKTKASPEAAALIAVIEAAGLPPRTNGLTADDPVTLTMVNIICSPRGRAAAVAAAERGVPAICGVDRMLARELGDRYSKDDLGTATAGSIVALVMREEGFLKGPEKPCEAGCISKTGATWLPKRKGN